MDESKRVLLVEGDSGKKFRITVPDDAKITFGPFSPPSAGKSYEQSDKRGTLRIYEDRTDKSNIIAVFAGVRGYRDISLIDYEEEVAIEEGAIIWKSDKNGYKKEEKVSHKTDWHDPLKLSESGED